MTTAILASFPSPSQGVWHIGFIPIRAYALCIIAGIVAALVVGDRRWVARGGDRGLIYDIALWAVPFGLVGGRLYHVMTDWRTYFGGDNGLGFIAALKIWDGGLGIWGAVALGGVGAWIGCRIHGVPLPAFGDAIAPGIILAQAIGRLGNYFNQELYGRETTMPWGLVIFERRNSSGQTDMLNGVSTGVPLLEHPVHPTFLYELLWNLLIFAVLLWADRRFKLGHGRLFALYVAGYCVGRFWVELMRSDYATLIAGIRVNSFTSTFVFLGAVIYIMVAPKGREAPETLRSKVYAKAEEATADDAKPARAKVKERVAELSAVEATSGVAAAAALAGDQDEPSPPPKVAETTETPKADEPVSQESPAEGLGAVASDEVGDAVADAPEVHEAAVEAADDADATAADAVSTDEDAEPASGVDDTESDAATPDVAEPDAAEGDADGLGSVEGDEVEDAVADAPEVHEAAAEAAVEADATAADAEAAEAAESAAESEAGPAAEPEVEPTAEPEPADETEADEATPEDAETPVSDEAADADDESEGLGAVEGDEVEEAVADAPELHEAASEAADDEAAEATAEAESDAEPQDATEPEAAEPSATEADGEPEGLGAVEGDEVGEAVAEAPEVHEAAVDAATEADEVADVEAKPDDIAGEAQEPEPEPEPESTPAVAAPAAEQPRGRWWRRR